MPTLQFLKEKINTRREDFSSALYFKLLLVALCCFLLALQVVHLIHYPLSFDDSFFSIVAKNLARGEGYSAVFFDRSYQFHFGISSGPLVIVPAALLIFFFGNQFWAAQAANISLIWILLITIFFCCENVIEKEKKYPFAIVTLFFILIFSAGSYGNESPDSLLLWHLLMGEIPAALFLVLAGFLLFAKKISSRKIIFGALCLGLSLLSKMLAIIAVSVIVAILATEFLWQKNFRAVFLLIFFTALPLLLFELVKIFVIGWEGYIDFCSKSFGFYKHNALAVATNHDPNDVNIQIDIGRRLTFLHKFFASSYFFLLPATFLILYCAFKANGWRNSLIKAGAVLILCFFSWILWWIFFSKGHERHLVIALICYSVALMLLLSSLDYQALSHSQIALIFAFVFLLLDARSKELHYLFVDAFVQNNQKLQQQIVLAKELERLDKQGVTMISCGNNSELEYLLPASKNFRKCEEVLTRHFDKKVLLVNSFIDPLTMPSMVISIAANQYYGGARKIPEAILARCSEQYLRLKNYSLNWCQ